MERHGSDFRAADRPGLRVASYQLQIIVMAAGQGKRMHSALPKALHPLAGRPLVAHVLDAARLLAPRRLCLVVGHGAERVRDALAAPDLTIVVQDPPRGTGDAVRVALAALPDDGVTVVANGDCPLVPAATLAALADVAAAGRVAVLSAHVSAPAGLGRVVRAAPGSVRAIVEDRDASPAERAIDEIYAGALAAPTPLLRRLAAMLRDDNAQREFYLTDVVAHALASRCRSGARCRRRDRRPRRQRPRAARGDQRIVQARQADALLKAGTWIADPGRIDVRGSLVCGRDVRIDVGCVFEGRVELADDVKIAPHCVLRNVTVGAGTAIAAFSHLEDATIGANCRVGPYARLRPGAALAEDVHVGNFVEVKASALGRGSKANHLAYIGDATIGSDVNVGAGAITANYDGANKHRTVIEDDASIGSNCVLVAPITVGKGRPSAPAARSQGAPPGVLTVPGRIR
jgi:bifunctional UDP-N-acetylglucosamine pyrophosphorylase/glucosamine-1-phosphate N-acetyltransferase